VQHWADYMRGDNNENFPFVRRRGPITLIGLSTSLPTPPLAATGQLHGNQLARLAPILEALGRENAFRVVLIHHPPTEGAHHFRRLRDAAEMREVLKKFGAELVLHGHHHEASLTWLPGPQQRVPVIGVPSASGSPDFHDDPAGYNLYEIDGEPGAWRCTMVARGWSKDDRRITELRRQPLMG
jgi:3',5'-cyclic AMP phosphodiesterase CpdA